ncbi:hypothetical protein NC653_020913 [Populus alba x Populus x berolinensis]|uniref:Uncharacterized protein n=1 Tax=Populus alba x Populus x berolinensis TaxID=444605 RepID=A0AAD6QD06_9ROSI|nr:hypothetical protein NC653_020913 [Populus alba x Populus x berolinensis]
MFLKYSTMSLRRRNDPVFTPPGMLFDLRSSRMLLENQIPLFILQRLFEVVQIPKQCTHFLTELAFRLIKYMISRDPRIHQQKFNQEGMQPNTPLINQSNQKHLRCATELQAAGIRIKGARTENLLDIKFVSGVLVIPPVIIH